MENLDDFMPTIDGNQFTIDISQEDFDSLSSEKPEEDNVEPEENPSPSDTPPEENVIATITPEDLEIVDKEEEETPKETNEDLPNLIFKELAERNVLQLEEGKESYSWEDLEKGLDSYTKEMPNLVMQAIVDSVPEKGRQLIDFVMTKGDQLSDNDLQGFIESYISDSKARSQELDFEDDDAVKAFLSQSFKAKGFKDNIVNAMVDALEDDDDPEALVKEAKKEFDAQKKASKSEEILQKEKQIKADREAAAAQRSANIVKELQATGWAPSRIQKVGDMLKSGGLAEVLKLAEKSDKALIQLTDFASYFDKTTGEFNYDAFKIKSEDNAAKSLKDKIISSSISSSATKEVSGVKPNKISLENLRPIMD